MKKVIQQVRKDGMFWLSCFLFLSVVAWVQPWHYERPTLRDQLGAGSIDGPFVVFRFDPRSSHGREFVATIDRAVQDHALALPIVLLLERERTLPFSSNVRGQLVDDHQHAIKTHQYALISEQDTVVFDGAMHHQPGDLRDAIFDYFNVEYRHPTTDLDLGSSVAHTVFSELSAEEVLPPRDQLKVWVAFQDVCFSCESGKRLKWIEEIAGQYKNAAFEFLLIEDIPPSEIAAFVEDHGVTIPLRKASADIREYWFGLMSEHRYSTHPLQGSFIAIDHAGTVVFRGSDDMAFLTWINQRAEDLDAAFSMETEAVNAAIVPRSTD